MLTEKTRYTLLNAGWCEGRTIDTSKFEAAYKAKGYPILESAMRVSPRIRGFITNLCAGDALDRQLQLPCRRSVRMGSCMASRL